jgi:hypothetical protein
MVCRPPARIERVFVARWAFAWCARCPRQRKAVEYPEDKRNREAAKIFDRLAATVADIPPDVPTAYYEPHHEPNVWSDRRYTLHSRRQGSSISPPRPRARAQPCSAYRRYALRCERVSELASHGGSYVLRLSGTLPPLSASLVMTSLCSQTFIFAEPSSLPV